MPNSIMLEKARIGSLPAISRMIEETAAASSSAAIGAMS